MIANLYVIPLLLLRLQIGNDVPLATVIEEVNKAGNTGNTSWKGRAQKIVVLKARVKEMREEIDSLRERLGEAPLPSDASTVMTRRTVSTMRTRLDVDASAKYELQVRLRTALRLVFEIGYI